MFNLTQKINTYNNPLHFQRLTEKLLFALNRNDLAERTFESKYGPSEKLELKIEKHRPVV